MWKEWIRYLTGILREEVKARMPPTRGSKRQEYFKAILIMSSSLVYSTANIRTSVLKTNFMQLLDQPYF